LGTVTGFFGNQVTVPRFETVWTEEMKYLIVIEKTKTGFSAYSPDLEGCIAAGNTRSSVEKAMRDAIKFHLEGPKAEGYKVPKPYTYSSYVEVSA
jgi:predicted RNase H-like HicB family nuclease